MLKETVPVLLASMLIAGSALAQQAPPSGETRPQTMPDTTKQGVTKPDTTKQGMTKPGTTMGADGDKHKMMGMGGMEADLSDAQLAMMIHQTNQHEMEMAKLGMERGSSAQVKALAKQIEADHKKSDAALTALATKKGWDLTGTGAMNDPEGKMEKHRDHAKMMSDDLSSKSGTDFDRSFLMAMQRGHNDAIAMLTGQAYGHPIDKELLQAIKKDLPSLEKHRSRSISVLEKEGPKGQAQASL